MMALLFNSHELKILLQFKLKVITFINLHPYSLQLYKCHSSKYRLLCDHGDEPLGFVTIVNFLITSITVNYSWKIMYHGANHSVIDLIYYCGVNRSKECDIWLQGIIELSQNYYDTEISNISCILFLLRLKEEL
jgi:hypothetical protein